MEVPKCRLCGERHWNTGICPSFVSSRSPAPPRAVEAAPAPVREPVIASDVAETVPFPTAPEAPVAAPKRRGKAKTVVPVDAVADLALSADDAKKAQQREKARIGMAKLRARQRAEKQQQHHTS